MPFAEEVVKLAAEAYAPGATLGQAFHRLVCAILGEHRMLYVDPLAESIRALAAPLLRDAVAAEPQLKQKLLDRNKELVASRLSRAGPRGRPDVAGVPAGKRTPPESSPAERQLSGRRPHHPRGGIAARAEHLSPNALLRPVVQDYILPTVAYVGGPAELAYLAQSQVIYGELLGRQPVALHRTGFTVLDSRSRKLLDRYGLCLPDFFHGEEALRARIAAKLVPPSLQTLLAETRDTANGAITG